MFKGLVDNFTWNSRFDQAFKFGREYTFASIMSLRLEEKILYWKVYGRKFQKTPESSIERAVFEFCEEFRRSEGNARWAKSRLKEMAEILERMQFGKLHEGRFVQPKELFPEVWQALLKYEEPKYDFSTHDDLDDDEDE